METIGKSRQEVKLEPPERDDVADIVEDVGIGPATMVHIDPRAELEKFEAASELMRKLRPASIRATKPQDWIKHGDKVYLQGTGVERISPLWGFVFGKYGVDREDHEDGEFAYVVTGPVGCRRTGVVMQIVGGRSSRDPFFDEFDSRKPDNWQQMDGGSRVAWRRAHRIKPDPLEIRKAAVTNWMTRSASMLAGLRGLTEADLKTEGITGIRSVEFAAGGKGGATAPGDLLSQATALKNEILRRTGGDLEAAKSLLREITAYDAYTNQQGKKVQAFKGYGWDEAMRSEKGIQIAGSKLHKHSAFGDEALASSETGETREPGSDDE